MGARPVKWKINDNTFVEIDNDGTWIKLTQDNDTILFSPTGASPAAAIEALYAAIVSLDCVFALPELPE